jgi:uncharacterized membrane protein YgdD (TMEM256/DUF423 family)
MSKRFLITGLIFGVLSVVFGAFGAHLLKKYLTPEQLVSFETGVKYMMYHGLFLIGISNISAVNSSQFIYFATVVGVVFFSGSIFLLTSTSLTQINFKFLGPVTPIGGLLLILSWLYAIFLVIKNQS